MLTNLITKEEAAKLLGVRPSTIGRYWRNGKLSYRLVGNRRRCIEAEVIHLKESRENITYERMRDMIVRLQYQVAQLEKTIEIHSKKLNLRKTVMFSDSDLEGLYTIAKEQAIKKVSADSAMSWSSALCSLGESDISRLKNLVNDPFPWNKFIGLIEVMANNIKRKRTYDEDISLQQAFMELGIAKDHIRRVGKIVFDAEGGSFVDPDKEFMKTLGVRSGPAKVKLRSGYRRSRKCPSEESPPCSPEDNTESSEKSRPDDLEGDRT